MWLATKFGFFSIVQKGGSYQVRARVRADLEELQKAAGLALVVDDESGTDYPCRIHLDAEQLQSVMRLLGESVDYPNFKDQIARDRRQRARLGIYHQVWALLAQLRR